MNTFLSWRIWLKANGLEREANTAEANYVKYDKEMNNKGEIEKDLEDMLDRLNKNNSGIIVKSGCVTETISLPESSVKLLSLNLTSEVKMDIRNLIERIDNVDDMNNSERKKLSLEIKSKYIDLMGEAFEVALTSDYILKNIDTFKKTFKELAY